jgi:2-dehydro-3-deoxyphosphogluconate aldolase/(4S)-4-hydroxy-2-oxoglutarate aldolase
MEHIFSWEKFNAVPIVGILRHYPADRVRALAAQYARAGLGTLEITMNSEGAADMIEGLIEEFCGRLNIGAGTVVTRRDLDQALAAGAQFIVAPVLDKSIIKACLKKGVPVMPGAYTPTEIYKAWSLGAAIVKVFPATTLGPGFIRELLAPLGKLKVLPTGGVHPGNFADFLRAGASGVGMGSHLFPRELIEACRWEELGAHFGQFVSAYRDYRQSLPVHNKTN